jgi:threonine aldolase
MRQAIADAVVGDDVLGDDPTVKRLEAMIAKLLGKEAGLYVPSGTMGNQTALFSVSDRGDEILCDVGCHILNYEAAGPAILSGLLVHPLQGNMGILSAEMIENNIRPDNVHCPKTKIVALENTHNRAGGTIYPLETIAEIETVARKHNMWMHLDGARLWNAHAATGIPLDKYASYFDSVSVCLSKGLGAPVGSVVLGNADFIKKVHRTRKIFGGGMRQVGILAAAGIYALENNLGRMVEDHKNATYLAENINRITGLTIDMETVQSNIVVVDVDPSATSVNDFITNLAAKKVLCVPFGPTRVRFVTHLDVDDEDCRIAVGAVEELMTS